MNDTSMQDNGHVPIVTVKRMEREREGKADGKTGTPDGFPSGVRSAINHDCICPHLLSAFADNPAQAAVFLLRLRRAMTPRNVAAIARAAAPAT